MIYTFKSRTGNEYIASASSTQEAEKKIMYLYGITEVPAIFSVTKEEYYQHPSENWGKN